jgi:amino acid adenylation domain-containing protein
VLTDKLRAQLQERKAEILSYLGDLAANKHIFSLPISRAPRSAALPLSFAQERLWFLEQLEPGNTAYNICRAVRLCGSLNGKALEASLNETTRRHEVLRTSFEVSTGKPIQVVASDARLKLGRTDLSQIVESDRDREINRLVIKEAERPFDLTKAPLLRARLLRLDDADHVLILATHHIVSDAWSMGIVTRELWSLYEACANDRPPPLQELDIQYIDFAVWQRNWLQGEVLESQLSYWKKELDNIPILNLPTDRTRPARQSFRGARQSIALGRSLTEAINELSHREGATPFMTLLAAFQVLLYRYSGQEDIVVGSPIANRARAELDSLIGFFVNTLVLRADLSGNPTFKEALARVREVCLGAYAHQDLPFEKLVEELKPERDTSRNPLFQVMIVLQNATRPVGGIPGLRIEPIEMATTRSPFDLSLFLREREGKYIGNIEYSTDLFDRDRIERMAGHLRTLLEGVVADPDRRISVLPILTEAERYQVLVEWNDTTADYPRDKCIHELFEEQADRTPDATAVEFDGQRLTYGELNDRANQLGHHLISLGVGPETLVGICIERSIELVVGLLGILKAGGACVPLDPSYPKERLEFMLSDARVAVLLTQRTLIEDGRWKPVLSQDDGMDDSDPRSSILDPRIKVVCLDRDWPLIAQQGHDDPKSNVGAENLAYVIYTSGSTGTPKGVAIEHRNTVNLLHWAKTVYTRRDLESVMASTSICFDLSVFELFVPLSWGGKVKLVDNALYLLEKPAPSDVTLINTVPSVMAALLSAGRLPETVRIVNLAGEPLRPEVVKQIYDLGMVERVYDLYGPSETTTYSTFTLRTVDGPATIGRPISNTQVYLLDSHLRAVPIGMPGELYIGGAGVARGYLNRPELTKEKFIADPFTDDPNSQLYRTGDIALYLPDGKLQFLGRSDNQIKLRGYRIELEEIESVLNQHPTVKESVVVVRARDSSGEKELVGYVAPKERSTVAGAELRDFLKDKLPGYMVPTVFVELDALPVSPNGKIDRSKLPAPKPFIDDWSVAPRTEIEELVAQIWRDVLNIETIGIHDNFFELEGHSLLAIQIISRVREAFDKEVELSALFDRPTIAGLAATIEKSIGGRSRELPPIISAPRDRPLPLSWNQEHLWRLEKMIPGTHFFNMPYVYRLTGDLNISALENTLQEIIRRHEALRTNFIECNDNPVQIIRGAADFRLSVLDLRTEASDNLTGAAAGVIMQERRAGFDLAEGSLLRVTLLRLTDSDYVLLVTIHHIIGDEWSMQMFWWELQILYEAFAKGQPLLLPDPRIQFGDYAVWERQLLEKGLLKRQLAFWRRRLSGPDKKPLFEQGGIENADLRLRREHRCIELEGSTFSEFKMLAVREHITPFTAVLTALTILLYSYTKRRNIYVGTLIANRRRLETQRTLGYFVNTVVFQFHLRQGMTYKELIRKAWKNVVDANANQEIPFEAVARALQTEEQIERDKLFQVLLVYNVTPSATALSGLKFAPIGREELQVSESIALTTYDVVFNFTESSTKLRASVNCKESLLNGGFVASIDEKFRAIIDSIIRKPNVAISPQ